MNDLASQLRERGFDVKFQTLMATSETVGQLQVTDRHGVTFYIANDTTITQALVRYEQKLTAFRLADNNK